MNVLATSGAAGAATANVGASSLQGGLIQVMDELSHGVLITTLQGRVVHANQSALHELIRGRSLALRDNHLQAHSAQANKILSESLTKASQGKRSLISLSLDAGHPLTIAVIALPADDGGAPERAALVFARASVCDALMLCFFAQSHSLTLTEERVLRILCQGYSAPEVAAQMKVAVSTVRSHVRSLCAKTQSSGVRELLKRLAVLPPMAPTVWQEQVH